MKKGSNFSVPIPKKFRGLLRCSTLRNPMYEEEGTAAHSAVMAPWRRMSLFFATPDAGDEQFPEFNAINPFPTLFESLDVPTSESIDELALALADRLTFVNREMSGRLVRQKCFVVNEIHGDAIQRNQNAPNIEKYQGHRFSEAYARSGQVIKVAVIEPHRIYRKGTSRLDAETTEIHPLALHTSAALFGIAANVRFDMIETGPWGVRAGILGWNVRAMNLGALLGEIFAEIPELYDEPKTGIFTDRYGRPTTYYGWILSSDEVAAPDVMCRMLELIGTPGHQRCHVARANKDVAQCLSESGLSYSEGQRDALAALLFGYLYLTPEEWRVAVDALYARGPNAALQDIAQACKAADMEELVSNVFTRLKFNKFN